MPELIFNGPAGRLEGRWRPGADEYAPLVVILHPHPLHGGTMNNKVVYALYQAFLKEGFTVLRFNFRGIGRSQGTFDGEAGELSDAATALDWLQLRYPNARTCWVAGFSFGAWISMQLMMRRPEVSRFVSVAPPADTEDFSFLAPCPVSGLIVHGTNDDVVPHKRAQQLAKELNTQADISVDFASVKGANHFFNDHIDTISGKVNSYIKKACKEETTHPSR